MNEKRTTGDTRAHSALDHRLHDGSSRFEKESSHVFKDYGDIVNSDDGSADEALRNMDRDVLTALKKVVRKFPHHKYKPH